MYEGFSNPVILFSLDTNTSTNTSVSSRPLPQRDDCCLQPQPQNRTLKLDDFRISDAYLFSFSLVS